MPGAGGVNSNITDMSLWLLAQMGAMPDVLDDKLLATIHAPYVKTPTERGRLRPYLERLGAAWYGFGWRSYDYAGHRLVGHRGGIRREPRAQRCDVWKLRCREIGGELCCEFGLAAALMGEGEEADHQTASGLLRQFFEQPVEGQAIGIAGEQLVAVDEIEQRHGFAPQGVNDVAVVNDMGTLAGSRRASPRQGHQQGALPRLKCSRPLTCCLT